MKKTKILQLYYEPHFSGITRHIGYIAKEIDAGNHDLWVLCSTGDNRISDFLRNILGNDRVKIVPPARVFSVAGVITASRIIRDNQIDVLHVHNVQSAVWGGVAGIMARVSRMLCTPHVVDLPSRAAEQCFYLLWRLLKPFEVVVTLTDTQRELLTRQKVVDPGRLLTILNCLDEGEILGQIKHGRDTARMKLGIELDAVVVCQIGRLVFQKNPEALIRIADLTRQKLPKMLFLLVGEGNLGPKLKEAIRKRQLEDVVRLTGFRTDALDILNAADIAVLTSRWEGLPYTLIEAICLRKPIVATNVPGNRDLVASGETGFLAATETEFAQRLEELARSEALREHMGNRGYERNKNLFDIRHMVREIETIYGRLSQSNAG